MRARDGAHVLGVALCVVCGSEWPIIGKKVLAAPASAGLQWWRSPLHVNGHNSAQIAAEQSSGGASSSSEPGEEPGQGPSCELGPKADIGCIPNKLLAGWNRRGGAGRAGRVSGRDEGLQQQCGAGSLGSPRATSRALASGACRGAARPSKFLIQPHSGSDTKSCAKKAIMLPTSIAA